MTINQKAVSIDEMFKNLIFRAVPKGQYVYGEDEDAIFKTYGDVSLSYYFIYSQDSNGISTGRLTRDAADSMCKNYGMSKEDLMLYAYSNTSKLLIPSVIDMSRIMEGIVDVVPIEEARNDILDNVLSYVGVTFKNQINGASAIFIPDVAKKISDILFDDLLISFTSRHEAMVHPMSMFNHEQLLEAINFTIDTATLPNDILTRNLFVYRRETKDYECIEPENDKTMLEMRIS